MIAHHELESVIIVLIIIISYTRQSASLQLLDPYIYQGACAKAGNMPNAVGT